MVESSYADRLKAIRAAFGLSQRAIAKRLNVNYRTWQEYEAGRNIPGGKMLEAILALGIDGTWLLTGQGEMLQSPRQVVNQEKSNEIKVSQEFSTKVFVALESMFAEEGAHITQKDMKWFWGYVWDHTEKIAETAKDDEHAKSLLEFLVKLEREKVRNPSSAGSPASKNLKNI